MKFKPLTMMVLLTLPGLNFAADLTEQMEENAKLGEIVVEAKTENKLSNDAPYTSSSTTITKEQAEGINATTIEDLIKYEPSLVVRRRYIGDPNGTVGMRGSNMFQTARTMVFADGVPLHYLLQTQWNGAPRWSLVSADETESVEVIYGPFSAEYSGNAMGGVVNINTKLPTKYEFNAEAGIFVQDFQHMGTKDTFGGHREFVSVGDRFEKMSVYLSHNHLQNKSQPMSFFSSNVGSVAGGETVVTGGYKAEDSNNKTSIYYGDTGADTSITDLTKLKVGYEMGDWLAHVTLAYEDRSRATDAPVNYLRDASGNTLWNANALFNGEKFTVSRSNFAVSEQQRETLLLGAALEGPIDNGWMLDSNVSHFDVMKDQSLSSKVNPSDPTYNGSGTVSNFDSTGWLTLDIKARTDNFLKNKDMNFITGYHFEQYKLMINSYSSDNYVSGEKTSRTGSVGGETITQAVFAQWGLQITPAWDLALGARYEDWITKNGINYNYSTKNLDLATRSEKGFSPKFSIGYIPAKNWKTRYSIGSAYRFPIVEELYHNEVKTNGTIIANNKLQPEKGLHQNMMFERYIHNGFMRVNLFHEKVKNVIFNQSVDAGGSTVSTFLPIDEVTTQGLEYIYQQDRLFESNIDARFNVTLLDSKIIKNSSDTSVVGNEMPRMPKWRANLFLTCHVNQDWATSAGIRYVGNSYGSLSNTDTGSNVYGAIDSYTFLDLKASYQVNKAGKINLGIDNVTDESAFVAHPWPQRTFYVQGSLKF
jgi:iron complex outermembrane receptor protein